MVGKDSQEANSTYPRSIVEQENKIAQEISPAEKGAFPVVGIGSSAGGLKALIKFFSNFPSDSGMAFVLIQHMSSGYKSLLPQIIQRYTRMPVILTHQGSRIEPDHVYVIPPDKNMVIDRRRLKLFEKPAQPYIAHSIDVFFRSMAENLKDQAIVIILSGSGSDGTYGARLVNKKLGLVIAQDPVSAEFNSMPVSAIQAGVADFVLYPEKIPEHLIEYVSLFFSKPPRERWQLISDQKYDLGGIFSLVNNRTGIDLSIYKPSTIYRRIARRMSMLRILDYQDYLEFMRLSQSEAHTLLAFFLISVTRFFQEPQAFITLKQSLKEDLKNQRPDSTFFAWTLGCGTGEETYSLAMLIQECFDEIGIRSDYKIIATDIDRDALNLARTGLYPSSIARTDVSKDRLQNFFNKKDSYYEIKPEIRSKITFTFHNHTDSPPVINAGLVSPRSMFIYLTEKSQRDIVPLFYQAMRPRGFLFLGTPDHMGRYTDRFRVLDPKWKIYRRV